MATLRSSFSSLSLPLRHRRVPHLNPTAQRRNLRSPHHSSLFSAIHRSHRPACSVSLQNPRSRIPRLRSDFICYRCGGYNHFARFCKNPVRCFTCGDLGHRSFICSKAMATKLTPNRCSWGESEDGSWILQASQTLDFVDRVDYMLLDPAVSNCISGHIFGLEDSIPEPSTEPLTELESISEGPIGEVPRLDILSIKNSQDFEGFSPDSCQAVLASETHKGVVSANGQKGFYIASIDLGQSFQKGAWGSAKISFGILRSLPAKVCRLKAPHPSARGKLGFSAPLWNLSDIRIIDKLSEDSSFELLGKSQGALSFFIKPCKFFLYCFLAAFRNQVASPPIGSWEEQPFSVHSSFISSSPDNAAVDRCIFGSERVFSRKSPSVKCKKKLPFADSIRRSPRLSRRSRSGDSMVQ